MIEVQTPKGVIAAEVLPDDEYPAIRVFIDGTLAALVECVVDDGRLMVRAYSKDYDEPMHVNWEAGTVEIPEEWNGTVKTGV